MRIAIIGGEARGRALKTAGGHDTRVATAALRSSLFDILAPRLEGARVLDLFAGIGSIGLEALSRGASQATFIERSHGCIRAIRENLEKLGWTDQATVVRGDALAWPRGIDARVDYTIGFVDPPYTFYDQKRRRDRIEALAARMRESGMLVVLKHPRGKGADGAFDVRRYGDTELSFYETGHGG